MLLGGRVCLRRGPVGGPGEKSAGVRASGLLISMDGVDEHELLIFEFIDSFLSDQEPMITITFED